MVVGFVLVAIAAAGSGVMKLSLISTVGLVVLHIVLAVAVTVTEPRITVGFVVVAITVDGSGSMFADRGNLILAIDTITVTEPPVITLGSVAADIELAAAGSTDKDPSVTAGLVELVTVYSAGGLTAMSPNSTVGSAVEAIVLDGSGAIVMLPSTIDGSVFWAMA